MNSKLKSREYVLARGRDVVARGWRLVAGAGQLKSALLSIAQHSLAVHGDQVAIGEEAQVAGFIRRSRNLGCADDFEDALHAFHELHGFSAAVWPNGMSVVDSAQQHFLATTTAGQQANTNFHQTHIEFGVGLAG